MYSFDCERGYVFAQFYPGTVDSKYKLSDVMSGIFRHATSGAYSYIWCTTENRVLVAEFIDQSLHCFCYMAKRVFIDMRDLYLRRLSSAMPEYTGRAYTMRCYSNTSVFAIVFDEEKTNDCSLSLPNDIAEAFFNSCFTEKWYVSEMPKLWEDKPANLTRCYVVFGDADSNFKLVQYGSDSKPVDAEFNLNLESDEVSYNVNTSGDNVVIRQSFQGKALYDLCLHKPLFAKYFCDSHVEPTSDFLPAAGNMRLVVTLNRKQQLVDCTMNTASSGAVVSLSVPYSIVDKIMISIGLWLLTAAQLTALKQEYPLAYDIYEKKGDLSDVQGMIDDITSRY